MLGESMMVDAARITVVRFDEKVRDPELQQALMRNQWYFRMKAHFGADVVTGLVYTVKGTATNVSDALRMPG